MGRTRILAYAAVLFAAACGNRGSVTFDIRAPQLTALDPLQDPRVSEYLIKSADGTLVGVASPHGSDERLPLGPLIEQTVPTDMVMSVLAGTELIGMARIRDVVVRPGVQTSYPAEVRKPFVFVGGVQPAESNPMNRVKGSQILDPTTSADLAVVLATSPKAVLLPSNVGAATATSDGRFLLAGHAGQTPGLTVVDTGSAATVGELQLPAVPWRLVVAPRDVAMALVDPTPPDGTVLLFNDLAGLTQSAKDQAPIKIVTRADSPRQVAFSPDGNRLYVLTGDAHNLDPCSPGAAPKPNTVQIYGLDGQLQGGWTLPSFAADLAVDAQSGTLVVSLPLLNQVATLDPATPSGSVTPQKLIENASCASAVRVANKEVFAVTTEVDAIGTNYLLKRMPLAGGTVGNLAFAQPLYEGTINDSDPADGKVSITLKLKPKYQYAYDLAVAPDGGRVVFATRTRFSEVNESFSLLSDLAFSCRTTVEIVEYGLYVVDTRNGTASYQQRSQLVTAPSPGKACITCTNPFVNIPFGCPSIPGDRPAGLAAVFGGL